MKNKSNIVPIVVGIAVVIAAGFYFIVRANNRKAKELRDRLGDGGSGTPKEETSTTETTTGTSNTQGGSKGTSTVPAGLIPNYSFTFPIKYGDGMYASQVEKRDNVKQLQYRIIQFDNRLLLPFNADGKFGSLTQNALKKIIGKDKITSQSDIDLLQKKTEEKAKSIMQNVGINFMAGIK